MNVLFWMWVNWAFGLCVLVWTSSQLYWVNIDSEWLMGRVTKWKEQGKCRCRIQNDKTKPDIIHQSPSHFSPDSYFPLQLSDFCCASFFFFLFYLSSVLLSLYLKKTPHVKTVIQCLSFGPGEYLFLVLFYMYIIYVLSYLLEIWFNWQLHLVFIFSPSKFSF